MIGVKDMEMPNSCMYCRFEQIAYDSDLYEDGDIYCSCGQFQINDENIRHPNCPLVEIKEGE